MRSVILILVLVATVSCAHLPHSSRRLLQGSPTDDNKTCELRCKRTYQKKLAECMKATGLADVKEVADAIGCLGSKAACEDDAVKCIGSKAACDDDAFLYHRGYLVEPKASTSKSAFQAAEAQCQKANSPQQDSCKAGCSSKKGTPRLSSQVVQHGHTG